MRGQMFAERTRMRETNSGVLRHFLYFTIHILNSFCPLCLVLKSSVGPIHWETATQSWLV